MAEPRAIHAHAIDDLRYIRDTMARADGFSAIPGWGGVLMGITALAASALAGPTAQSQRWLIVWLVELALAVVIAVVTMAKKARTSSAPLLATPARISTTTARRTRSTTQERADLRSTVPVPSRSIGDVPVPFGPAEPVHSPHRASRRAIKLDWLPGPCDHG